MELTPIQQVISNNFEAHILKLKDELRYVSEELDKQMRLKEETSKNIEVLSHKHKSLSDDIEVRNSDIIKKESELNRRELALKKREDKLESDIIEFKANKEKENIDRNSELNERQRKINDIKKITESYILNQQQSKEENDRLTTINNELLYSIQKLHDERRQLIMIVNNLSDSNEKAIKKYNVDLALKQEELKEIEDKIAEEKEKIVLPLQRLKAEEEEFMTHYKNFEIRKARLKKYLEKYFPNEILKI